MQTRARVLAHTWRAQLGAQPSSAPTAVARVTSCSWADAHVVLCSPLARAASRSRLGTTAPVTNAQVRNG